MAAVPSIGRASRVEAGVAPEADATRALYEQYANQVFRYCLHQLGSREEAEDAVQSTFLNAFRGIKRGVVPELESAWLFKIAHNVCLSRRRSAWRRGRVESPADFEVIEEVTPAPSRRADELIGLQDVLERLPESQRRAILLREWQGLSYREIAAELELTQAAVETLIFRARRSLASGLEQPPAQQKRRAARAFDWSNLLAGLKTALIGGSAAAKVAATLAVVSATTVVAAEPLQHHVWHHPTPPAKTHAAARVVARTTSTVVQRPAFVPAASVPAAPASRIRHSPPAHHHAAAVTAASAQTVAPAPVAPAASPPVTEQPTPAPVVPAPTEQAPAQPDKAGKKDGRQGANANSQGHGQGQDQSSTHDNGNGKGRGNGQGKGDSGPPTATQPVVPQVVTPQAPVSGEPVSPVASGAPTDGSAQDQNQNGRGADHGAPQSSGRDDG
ncbi:MAG TPA: RNA polymerase sigma factor [Gaiellaceae bacterium]